MEIYLVKGTNPTKGLVRYIADDTILSENTFRTIEASVLEQRLNEVVFFYSKPLAQDLANHVTTFQQRYHPDSALIMEVVKYRCSVKQMKLLRAKTYRYRHEVKDDE